jgi:Tfp pilus assembly protein PilX
MSTPWLVRNKCLRRKSAQERQGAALLFCLFVIFVVTLMVVNVLDTTTLQLSALRNTIEYERALYLANAGVHHAVALLEADTTWRGTISEPSYPADDTYSATAVDGANAYTAVVTSSGVAGEVTRNVTAVVEL